MSKFSLSFPFLLSFAEKESCAWLIDTVYPQLNVKRHIRKLCRIRTFFYNNHTIKDLKNKRTEFEINFHSKTQKYLTFIKKVPNKYSAYRIMTGKVALDGELSNCYAPQCLCLNYVLCTYGLLYSTGKSSILRVRKKNIHQWNFFFKKHP